MNKSLMGTSLEKAGCRLLVKADHESYRLEQPISLRLETKNVGDRNIQIVRTNLMQVYRFEVRRPDGKPAPLTDKGQRQLNAAIAGRSVSVLDRGESDVTVVPALNKLYDMTPVGKYQITVYRGVFLVSDGEKQVVEIPSNTIELVVVPNKSD